MTTAPMNHDNHEHDEMLSIEEAAALLRVPVATMRYWRYCGDGPHSFRLGRHVRYWQHEVVVIARESCPALAFAEACAEIRAAFARRRGGDRTPRASAPSNPPGPGGAAT